jgi:hypothetical protein
MEYLETMTEDYFGRGFEVPEYLQQLRNYPSLVKQLMEEARAEREHSDRLQKIAGSWKQPVRATAQTEDWCGDWACNLPILADLFEKAGIPFRVFRGSEHPELKERHKRDGVEHIPVVSLWDGNGEEIGRWIEAPEKVDEMKRRWKEENPRLMELYAQKDDDKAAAKEFAKLYRRFLEEMAVWYRQGMWSETTREIAELAEEQTEASR